MSTLAPTPSTAADPVTEVERVTLVRMFDAELAAGDGRTLEARIVPYGTPATVSDPPDFRSYQEQFASGAFERQIANPDRVRVWLNFEHDEGLRGIVGHGVQLRDQADGLHGSFRVHENPDGDKALQLVGDGLLPGLSMEFVALRSRRTADGVVERLRAHIDKVSLCRTPAYEEAQVLAVRAAPVDPVVLEAPPVDPELEGRLAALGVAPLARVATTSQPWDASPGRFDDEQYLCACLIVRSRDLPAKQRGLLPVFEPNGTLNTNALADAAAALAGARGGVSNVPQADKATAARKLVRYYGAAGMTPPAGVLALAHS